MAWFVYNSTNTCTTINNLLIWYLIRNILTTKFCNSFYPSGLDFPSVSFYPSSLDYPSIFFYPSNLDCPSVSFYPSSTTSPLGLLWRNIYLAFPFRFITILSLTLFACSPLMHPYMEKTCTPHPKIILHIHIFLVWEIKP